jgi:hypothetical protein
LDFVSEIHIPSFGVCFCFVGELDEVSEELQKSRHKLATLRSQKEAAGGPLIPAAIPGLKVGCGNQGLGSEKASEGTCELEAGLLEMKALADQRLQDLQEALQKQLHLSEKIQHMQDLLESERHILLSHPYQLLTDQVQYLRSEIERCQRSVDQLQVCILTTSLHSMVEKSF